MKNKQIAIIVVSVIAALVAIYLIALATGNVEYPEEASSSSERGMSSVLSPNSSETLSSVASQSSENLLSEENSTVSSESATSVSSEKTSSLNSTHSMPSMTESSSQPSSRSERSTSSRPDTSSSTQSSEQYVWIAVDSGEKYHKESCRTIKNSETKQVTKEEAAAQGYEACKVCKP